MYGFQDVRSNRTFMELKFIDKCVYIYLLEF